MGWEIADAFAARGAHVAIASRKLDNCVAAADDIRTRHHVRALPVGCHVSSWPDCDALVEQVYAEFGRIDVLVNNAGLSPRYPSLDEMGEALFDKVLGVNPCPTRRQRLASTC
jgi:NAD(P)-dependent dehydrogenase (short-subunit alcohol dehydrogenase family)